jgi:hypothetical protein
MAQVGATHSRAGDCDEQSVQGPTAWDDYLSALETATPTTQAIGVTDYYVLDTYQEILKRKAAGRLPDAKLIFPNVELRLDVATSKSGFVNLHLFVSPEDPDQACIDPGGRAFVGAEPPSSATPSQVLCKIQVLNAPWLLPRDG